MGEGVRPRPDTKHRAGGIRSAAQGEQLSGPFSAWCGRASAMLPAKSVMANRTPEDRSMARIQRVTFTGSGGDPLAARLDLPPGPIRSYALFAHCFTCSKDLFATQRIASELALRGMAVLRFDFTGLGASGGEFANSNFSSNVEDLRRAAAYLAQHYGPVGLLIGHSRGGGAVVAAAGALPEVKAGVTMGAPADTEHVISSFRAHVPAIEREGEAEVELVGRRFTITKQFLDDVRGQDLKARIHDLH